MSALSRGVIQVLCRRRDGLVRDLVALVLEIANAVGEVAGLFNANVSRRAPLRRLDDAGGVYFECIVEDSIPFSRADHVSGASDGAHTDLMSPDRASKS